MVQVLMAAKGTAMLWLLCTATVVRAQAYGQCAYGRSIYNNNVCPIIALTQKTDTAHVAINKTAAVLRVFPNPAQQYCMLQLPPDLNGKVVKVQVFNSQQELVAAQNIVTKTLLQKIPLPVLASGLYQVKVSAGNAVLVTTLEIQH